MLSLNRIERWRRVRFGWAKYASLAMLALASACVEERPSEAPRQQSAQALYGVGVQVDNTATAGFVGTVGRLFAPGTSCSGTAIARNKFLTAAHCVCNNGQVADPTKMSVFFPQAGGSTYNVATVAIHPKALAACPFGTARPYDFAVLTFFAPIPVTVMAAPAQVYFSNADSAWSAGYIGEPASLVGFGNQGKGTGAPNDGSRRFGPALWLYPDYDPCDKPLEQDCWSGVMWKSPEDANLTTVPGKGDSGGPLFVTRKSGGVAVAGVFSGWITGPQTSPKIGIFTTSLWAATSNAAKFIADQIDGDDDGITDDIDNCPATSCPVIENCKNPDQTDSDNDGVGEVCDNCPASACASPALCINPMQADTDGDLIGNVCDFCPADLDPNLDPNAQADSDGDRVGDECDDCDTPDPYPFCLSNADCNGTICIRDGQFVGHCSAPVDLDTDGIQDACDACLNFPNEELNSNPKAETRDAQPVLPDDCDPLPLLRVASQAPNTITVGAAASLCGGDGAGPDDVQPLYATRWLGSETPNPAPNTYNRPVAYRHCSCMLGNTKLPFDVCVSQTSPTCSWDDPLATWDPITVRAANGAPIQPIGAMSTASIQFTEGQSAIFNGIWEWRDDLAAGRIFGKGACGPVGGSCDAPESCETYGAVFTRVLGVTTGSARDTLHPGLRQVFRLYATPGLSKYVPQPFIIPACFGVDCLPWVDPKLYLRDPALLDFTNGFTQPVALAAPGGGVVQALVGPTHAIDVTSNIHPTVGSWISNPALAWLTHVEPDFRIRQARSRPLLQAVVLPRDWNATSTVHAVTATENGLVPAGRTGDAVVSHASAPPLGAFPIGRTGHRALYSALDDALYMVGGVTTQGFATQDVWHYSISSSRWTPVKLVGNHRPSSKPISVAYNQAEHSLFVLDIDDDAGDVATTEEDGASGGSAQANSGHPPKGSQPRARLVRYDLAVGASAEVATWPWAGMTDAVYLAALSDGQLALVTSHANSHHVWRLSIDATGKLTYSGVMAGPGRVLGQPAMGERELYVLIEHKGELVYEALDSFVGGPPCQVL